MRLCDAIKWQALVLLMAGTCSVYAQRYTESPGDSIVMETTESTRAIVMNITQVHLTADTLHFHWSRISAAMPADWTAAICDNGLCYDSLEDHGMMIPIVPGDNGLMSIHCTAASPGTAVIRYTLYEDHTPQKIDTLTWLIDATVNNIGDIKAATPLIYCYQGHLLCRDMGDGFSEISVYEPDGRQLYQAPITGATEMISLPGYTGLVIIQLSGKNKTYDQKVLMN